MFQSGYSFKREIVEVVAILVTLVAFLVNWNRSDSARAQELVDLSSRVQSLEATMNTNDQAMQNKIDQILIMLRKQ